MEVKTPERRAMYKGRTPTGAWKDRFRKGCMQRLKSKRESIINQARQTGLASNNSSQESEGSQEFVNQLMVEEWEKMQQDSPSLPDIPISRDHKQGESDEDINDVLAVLEEIRNELISQEQLILQQYEEDVHFNEESLCAAIELLSTASVICPVCKKNNLLQSKEVIFCHCGIRIDTGFDGIDLEFVKKQLFEAVSAHSSVCGVEPDFSCIELGGTNIRNLVMSL